MDKPDPDALMRLLERLEANPLPSVGDRLAVARCPDKPCPHCTPIVESETFVRLALPALVRMVEAARAWLTDIQTDQCAEAARERATTAMEVINDIAKEVLGE